jgi:hypothetical protein
MGRKPSPLHSLDRIDNDGPYNKENCRWATKREQANNKRTSRLLTLNGTAHTLAEWSRITKLTRAAIAARLDRAGWSVERTLTQPKRGHAAPSCDVRR